MSEEKELAAALRRALELINLQVDFYLRDGKKDLAVALIKERTPLQLTLHKYHVRHPDTEGA